MFFFQGSEAPPQGEGGGVWLVLFVLCPAKWLASGTPGSLSNSLTLTQVRLLEDHLADSFQAGIFFKIWKQGLPNPHRWMMFFSSVLSMTQLDPKNWPQKGLPSPSRGGGGQERTFGLKDPCCQALSAALNFELPEDQVAERVAGRLYHKGSGRTYHKTLRPVRASLPPRVNNCATQFADMVPHVSWCTAAS